MVQKMKYKIIYLLVVLGSFISCKNETDIRVVEQLKEAQKKEIIFNNINKGWVFAINAVEPTTQSKINRWIEWRAFLSEINQKPKSSIGAFQKKSAALSKKVIDLNNNIPSEFNNPQIKSRITAVTTKIKTLDLFIHLNQIPDEKVVQLITDVNIEIKALQRQMEEIVHRSLIPREAGEPDYIKIKDSSRAIPDSSFPIQ